MMLESLKVENIMGSKYEIVFDPRYTVIVGDNRQGKTINARLIMLALFGTKQPKELHPSWRLKPEELVFGTEKGSVELILINAGKRYKILREFGKKPKAELSYDKSGTWVASQKKDADIKTALEEDVGITPGLMNVIMSNEQSLVGSISYDDTLQASVWEGWKWKTEIIKSNIDGAAAKCLKEKVKLEFDQQGLETKKSEILTKWSNNKIFPEWDGEKDISEIELITRYKSIKQEIENVINEIKNYSEFYDGLNKLEDLDNVKIIQDIVRLCEKKAYVLDEKGEITQLKQICNEYLKTLKTVMELGGLGGIQTFIRSLEDEKKKLQSAKELVERTIEPIKAECTIYLPEKSNQLIIQIPDEIAHKFKYEEIARGGISVPYDELKEADTAQKIEYLNRLTTDFDAKRGDIRQFKNNLRDVIGKRKDDLNLKKETLNEQKTILKSDCANYSQLIEEIARTKSLIKKLETAKTWLKKIFEALDEEESLKKIRKETVNFINRIYERIYNWDINATLIDGDKIIIQDSHGHIRSHPSGSETHIMGLAWRWMIARAFDLPLVLDELDVLLDSKNFERTKRLIQEEMDRQTIILTLREDLKELPGKAYKIIREDGISTITSYEK